MTQPSEPKPIPAQLLQIAHEQEGGAERVLGQIEVVQHSFEEIQSLTKECQDILHGMMPPGPELEGLIAKLEAIGFHADNGTYNIQGAFDLYQYQDVVRQKLEKVGRRLIDISQYVLSNLNPEDIQLEDIAPSGRDILTRDAQANDASKEDADQVIAEFFARTKMEKAAKRDQQA